MWHLLLGRGADRKNAAARGTRRDPIRRQRQCFLEPLEERRVLTTLFIDAGTAGPDTIDISASESILLVLRNGSEIHNASVSSYDFVQINAADGGDTINLLSVPSGGGGTAVVTELESNDTYSTAQELPLSWSSAPNPNVNDDFAQPTNLPHVTVQGSFDGTADVYHFQVDGTGGFVTGVFDIDSVDQDDFDAYLELLDASGNPILFANGDDAPFPDLTAGSSAYNGFDTYDPLFGFVFPEGTNDYYIRVKESPVPGVVLSGTPTYDLQVVVSNYSVGGGPPPGIIINGGDGSDALNVAAGLMPISAVDENVVEVGPAPFAGTLRHGAAEVVEYMNLESFSGGAAFTVRTDLIALGMQDGSADNTFVRPNVAGTQLLVDVNGVPYFGGGISQIAIVEVNGSGDADTITVQNTVIGAHVDGGSGADTITTASGPDIVYGGGGDDTISTGDGDDYVAGGADNDTISGSDGNDSLHGNSGDDILSGQAGHDIVSGGAGSDQVAGHQGQDVLIGGSGADQVLGNSDRDLLFASGIVVQETGGPVSLGESDSSQFGDDNYFRLQDLREDWLDVIALVLTFQALADKYDSGTDDGVEDKLQGGNGDDVFFTDGTARIVDSAADRETTT